MKELTAKELVESAINLPDLQEVAPKAMRASNPINGERADTLAMLLQLAFSFGRANSQTFQQGAAEFRAKHPDAFFNVEEEE
jgi:hypothetical protein